MSVALTLCCYIINIRRKCFVTTQSEYTELHSSYPDFTGFPFLLFSAFVIYQIHFYNKEKSTQYFGHWNLFDANESIKYAIIYIQSNKTLIMI